MTTTTNSANPTMRWILLTLAVVLVLVGVWLVRDILLLTVTAIILAVLLTTPIRFFVRRGVPRPLAMILTLVILVITIVIALVLLLPGLIDQFSQLISSIPKAAQLLSTSLTPENLKAQYPILQQIDPATIQSVSDQINHQILDVLSNLPGQVAPLFSGLASAILSVLIVVFLAMYFVADPDTHERGLIKLVPLPYRRRAYEVLVKLETTLRKFLHAQIILMVLVGIAEGGVLALIGLPLAGALGTITGLLAFIPNFGPLVALIPIIAVAVINTPNQILLVIFVFYIIQFIMGQLIAPILMGREVNLPPAIILLSQIVAGIFFGFLGLLLSVPLAAIAVVLVREIYIKDVLGDVDAEESLGQMIGEPNVSPESAQAVT
ncbi:MAG TPA: AI-2E family transporter [Aggregatilineales bacterium]|nr:AI-2E family transporter [Aggregatilineales bacterium]